MLSRDARPEWLTLLAIGTLLAFAAGLLGWWWVLALVCIATVALLAFFRDPNRRCPTQRGVMVAPADGRVSSIHELEHFEPFDDAATCVRIFLSVFDVHVNRSPCHGEVTRIEHRPGRYLNALNPDSAEQNEANLIVLVHPIRRYPLAAVRQVAGLLARTIHCSAREGQTVQRGQRIGIIKLGSTTELYVPRRMKPQVLVRRGEKVKAGLTVLVRVTAPEDTPTAGVSRPASRREATAEPSHAEHADVPTASR